MFEYYNALFKIYRHRLDNVLKCIHHSRFYSAHKWEDLCDRLIRKESSL